METLRRLESTKGTIGPVSFAATSGFVVLWAGCTSFSMLAASETTVLISQSLRTNLERETRQYQSIKKEEYAEHARQTDAHFSTIQQSFQAIKDQSGAESDALLALEQELRSAMSAFNEKASSWTTELTTSCSRICKESVDTSEKQVTLLD